MSIKVKALKASYGDSILISFPDINDEKIRRNILIDGGTKDTYESFLKNEIKSLIGRNECIDLLIITHIDDDHIGGIIRLYEDSKIDKKIIKEVWFNSGKFLKEHFENKNDYNRDIPINVNDRLTKGLRSGITLEKKLSENSSNWFNKIIHNQLKPFNYSGYKITVLSPSIDDLKKLNDNWQTEKSKLRLGRGQNDYKKGIDDFDINNFSEDNSIPNGSSIAFLLEFKDNFFLFLADSYPSVVVKKLRESKYSENNKLKIDLMKLSHHGSKNNTNLELLKIIDCQDYLISTSGNRFNHPDKECLARIIKNADKANLYFNYDIFANIFIENKGDYNYKFKCKYLDGRDLIYE